MSRDLLTSWSGAQAAWSRLEVIAGNVANANTTGYREQRVAFSLTGGQGPLDGALTRTDTIAWSDADGELRSDGVPTHLALRGEGYFTLEDGTFTRDGTFRLDDEGQLVTQDGTAVLGDGGPIEVEAGEILTVEPDGTLSGSESGEIGRLQIVRLANAEALGGNRWKGDAEPVDEPEATTGCSARKRPQPKSQRPRSSRAGGAWQDRPRSRPSACSPPGSFGVRMESASDPRSAWGDSPWGTAARWCWWRWRTETGRSAACSWAPGGRPPRWSLTSAPPSPA